MATLTLSLLPSLPPSFPPSLPPSLPLSLLPLPDNSGSTAVIVVVTTSLVACANLGDSRAVLLARQGETYGEGGREGGREEGREGAREGRRGGVKGRKDSLRAFFEE